MFQREPLVKHQLLQQCRRRLPLIFVKKVSWNKKMTAVTFISENAQMRNEP